MEIEFHGRYDEKLLKRAVALAFPPSRVLKIFSYALLGGFLFLAGWAIRDYLRGRQVTLFELAGLLLPLVIIAYFILQRSRQPGVIAGELWEDPASRQPLSGKATAQGVTLHTTTAQGASQRHTPWERFTRLRQNDDLSVLVTDGGVLFAVPRRFFASQEDWEQFLELAQSKVAEAR